jgi:hypothetical protein
MCIPQGLPWLPFHLLFYFANLDNICNSLTLSASGFGLVDNVNSPAYRKLAEGNCRMLLTVHKMCLKLARSHGELFAVEKYILVHFTKAHTKHNSYYPLNLPTSMLHPSPYAYLLGVILDKKLSFQPKLQLIRSKLTTLTYILTRLTASIQGTTLWVVRLPFTTFVCPAIGRDCSAWRAPQKHHLFLKENGQGAARGGKLLSKFGFQCL